VKRQGLRERERERKAKSGDWSEKPRTEGGAATVTV